MFPPVDTGKPVRSLDSQLAWVSLGKSLTLDNRFPFQTELVLFKKEVIDMTQTCNIPINAHNTQWD